MHSNIRQLLVIMFFSVICSVQSVSAATVDVEVNHLLNFIQTSGCIFIRNNTRHDPEEAVKHIEKKYNYLKKRIKSAEDFIKGAATGSSISGKPYMISCDGREMETADWLRAELKRYREK